MPDRFNGPFLFGHSTFLSFWLRRSWFRLQSSIVGILRTLLRYKNWFVLNRLGHWMAGWDLTIDAKLIHLFTGGAIVVFAMSSHEWCLFFNLKQHAQNDYLWTFGNIWGNFTVGKIRFQWNSIFFKWVP